MNKKSHKLTTGIDGLDNLFFGGIHIEEDDARKNIIINIRGNKGTKKTYLEIPLCRGLCKGLGETTRSLIVSLNKTNEQLHSIYCNIYIQDFIHKIQIESGRLETYRKSLKNIECIDVNNNDSNSFHNIVINKLKLETKNDDADYSDEQICSAIRNGLLYYNERTQYIHIRRPKRNDDNDRTKILRINAKRLSEQQHVSFFGKDNLLDGDSNNLVEFHNLIHKLNEDAVEDNNKYGCIVIDGLSRLTEKEMEQCPFDALIDILRRKCRIAIITMDERLPISKITPDIVLEMRIRPNEKNNFTCRELCISKCLHQQNAYGWHMYKLRNYGIEVIPSIHKQLYRRNYVDNAIPEALLPINRPPFWHWLEESIASGRISDISDNNKDETKVTKEKTTNDIKTLYNNYIVYKSKSNGIDLYDEIEQGGIKAFFSLKNSDSYKDPSKPIIISIMSEVFGNGNKKDIHILFIDFNHSRKDFWNIIKGTEFEAYSDRIHFFRIRYGCIFADELLYIMEQQVNALANIVRGNNKRPTYYYYNKIHVVMGDMRYLEFGHPSLFDDELFLPAYVDLTKCNYMQNYIYMSGESENLHKKILFASDYFVESI